MSEQPTASSQRRPATPEEAKALAHPLRIRILRLCWQRPHTNKELGECLEREPGALLHHVRRLHRTGFLELSETRPGPRGTTEKLYRATGKSWTLDVADTDQSVAFAALEAFREEARAAGAQRQFLINRFALQLSDQRAHELRQRLHDLVAEYSASPDAHGQIYGAFFGMHLDAREDSPPPDS
ncbi:winged helix-turn-helix domain-containing protein [Lipingzhangella sp. LS1_29]|uniref:Winged helix-turn-helix domain-containing protein n=1 Tax=Lipingzhangella rawalii TaxID=2055835 RepID=A0ABU2H1A3_9ACTN|nr:winged helix-turn-helix domain-containing protein [Lipingzhangella rawalii]MDS1269078.1 winged helix-turn-helix domain-containing protein [Lipingzhangella rawalii]